MESCVHCIIVERQIPLAMEVRIRQAVLSDNQSFDKLSYPISCGSRGIPWRSKCMGCTDNRERNILVWV